MPELITEPQLKTWAGYTRRSDLEKFLRGLGIPFGKAKGGAVVTTQGAIDGALLKLKEKPQGEFDSFEVG